jgi:hypothetical protein
MSDESWGAIEALGDEVLEDETGNSSVIAQLGGIPLTIDGEDVVVFPVGALFRSGIAGAIAKVLSSESAWSNANVAVERMLSVITAVEEVQAEQADAARPALLKAMLTADIDPVPAATLAQARRLAQHRERLLVSGAFTIEALRDLRGDAKSSTTRTWLTRRRAANELFTVIHEGAALVPAFQLDREAQPIPGVRAVLEALAPAELSPWAMWTWFTAGSAWLGGSVPADQLDSEPERVATAAQRFASNTA